MRYDLVIFDNDGVLVDSEPISNRHLAAYLTELGHPTTYEDSIRDYMGSAMHRIHDLILERTGQRLPEDFDDVFHARVFAAFEQELKAVSGAAEVLEKLAAEEVPYCVASSGSHERIRVGHRAAGLERWFDDERIFSSQDVGRGSRPLICSCTPRSGWASRRSGARSSRTARWECGRPWRRAWTCTGSRR
ncbi:Hydrolase OS=Streptomyces glaucescens OX=1907 GN=SGLAU_19100 PE=4 SV=1 [Streptomyces glaucescens]